MFDPQGRLGRDTLADRAGAMALALAHRGPDGQGVFADGRMGLGHRRLAIIDRSEAGAQPMTDAHGRTLVFNGEVYNHRQLRAELEQEGNAPAWRGRSDTEILLACLGAWGVERTLARCRGMFALALWNPRSDRLTLARDRFGEKPLYYAVHQGLALFGSEIKALKACPGFDPAVDQAGLNLFLHHGFIPAPRTIHQGVSKLPPGCLLHLTGDDVLRDRIEPEPYFDLPAELALAPGHAPDPDKVADHLEALLLKVVENEMVADVPLGSLLSGGVDSSLVTAMMQAVRRSQGQEPVRTFTIGFSDPAYDEASQARAVAGHLGCDHTELTASPDDALALVDELPAIYDEPLADPSQLPTCLVSRLTRQQVTVCLTGDGGDEMFGGYNRHFWGPSVLKRAGAWPAPLRSLAGASIRALPPRAWDGLAGLLAPLLSSGQRQRLPGDKMHKLARAMQAKNPGDLHRILLTLWPDPNALLARLDENPRLDPTVPPGLDPALELQIRDCLTYLPGDILAKVDRAAMAVGLETRAPFLDHRVALFGLSLPNGLRVGPHEGTLGRGKVLLKRLLARHLPEELFLRPKMGFGAPVAQWLRGPLRSRAEALLNARLLEEQGYFQAKPVRKAWQALLAGRDEEQYRVWALVQFQAWVEHWNPPPPSDTATRHNEP